MGRAIAPVGVLLALAGRAAAMPEWTQTFDLVPGWNAIYLQVQPTLTDPAVVFDGVPVRSVWTRGTEPSSVEFIRDPQDALIGQRGWLAYVPADREDAMAPALADRELVSIEGNRAFLINVESAATLRISGPPLVPVINWQANQFTLAGFPIDPDAAPTFAAYFRPSAAHRDQPVYRLLPSGVWQRVAAPSADRMRYGEAYWVFSATGSDFVGPLALDVPSSSGLDFGRSVSDLLLTFTNLADSAVTVTLEALRRPDAVPLSYRKVATSGADVGTFQWPELSGPLALPAAAGGSQSARLAVRRGDFSKAQMASVVSVRNGTGTRWLLPLTADGGAAAAAVSGSGASSEYAGLWIGSADVRKVSQPQLGSATPVSTLGQGNVCAGGSNEGGTCESAVDCPGTCTLRCAGGSRKDMPCTVATQVTDCPGSRCGSQPRTCAGGINSGLACAADSMCPGSSCAAFGVCVAGARTGQSCTTASDCPGSSCNTGSRCDGGLNDGRSCTRASDCAFRCDQSGSGSSFPMRLLLHVDGSGTVRLLKQVIQMWQDGTTKPDPANTDYVTDATPGRYVLLTDDALIQQRDGHGELRYGGATLRDGVRVGKRLSTAHFDFPGNDFVMTGSFGAPNTVTASITLAPDFPTNPYRHKFHPDHDNLDSEGQPVEEAFEITRAITLTFSASDPSGLVDPDFGFDTVGGVYKEEITGLHRNAIQVEGVFRLQRADTTAELNQ